MTDLFIEVWSYLKLLKWTTQQLRSIKSWVTNKPKSIDLEELINGEIDIAKSIKTTALISEYIPIMPATELNLNHMMSPINFSIKSYEINQQYCSIIQDAQLQEPSTDSVPIFYTYDTPRPVNFNARKVEVIGETVSIPEDWLKKLDIKSPIGIMAKKIVPKGDTQDLHLPVWIILEGATNNKLKLKELISGQLTASPDGDIALYKFGMPIDKDMDRILFICGSSGHVYQNNFVFKPTNLTGCNPDETRIVNFAKGFNEIGYNVKYAYDFPKLKI